MFGHIYPVERAFRRDDACGEWDKPIVLGLKAALVCGSGLFDAFSATSAIVTVMIVRER